MPKRKFWCTGEKKWVDLLSLTMVRIGHQTLLKLAQSIQSSRPWSHWASGARTVTMTVTETNS